MSRWVPGGVREVIVSPGKAEIVLGGAAALQAAPLRLNGTRARVPVAWSVDDSTVARVDSAGTVTSVSVGTTTVSATAESKVGTAVISVVTVTFRSVVAGATHSCGLTTGGTPYCWGGTPEPAAPPTRLFPTRVRGDTSFASLSTSDVKACGVTSNLQVYCWSVTGNYDYAPAPNPVAGASLKVVTHGFAHDCGLSADHRAFCWGSNQFGQLGVQPTETCGGGKFGPSYPCAMRPLAVSDTLAFLVLDAGAQHTCGVTGEGEAYCWGSNRFGQLGDSMLSATHGTPRLVPGAAEFVTISAGAIHTCGLDAAGVAYCWGENTSGQLGIGTFGAAPTRGPVQVAGNERFRAISSGVSHTCALTTDSRPFCWGNNAGGQLGDGSTVSQAVPVPVAGGVGFEDLSAGAGHTCGRSVAGLVYCWGSNTAGALGTGDRINQLQPALVVGQR